MAASRLAGLLLLLLLGACGDPIVQRQTIADTRVLAVRIESELQPERSSVSPGEAATAQALVVDPAEPERRSWKLAACLTTPTTTGVVHCQRSIAEQESEGLSSAMPALRWLTPEAASSMAVVGIVCSGSTVDVAGSWPHWGCADREARATLFSADVFVQSHDWSNRNPSAQDDQLSLDQTPWAAPEGPLYGPCAENAPSPDLPLVQAGGVPTLQYLPVGDDTDQVGEQQESLLLAHYSTAGELERPFSMFAEDAPAVEVSWQAPPAIAADGRVVRFYFVLRDQRGGVDWTERQLCLVP